MGATDHEALMIDLQLVLGMARYYVDEHPEMAPVWNRLRERLPFIEFATSVTPERGAFVAAAVGPIEASATVGVVEAVGDDDMMTVRVGGA